MINLNGTGYISVESIRVLLPFLALSDFTVAQIAVVFCD